ncbi:anthranilate synthase component I family protein [Cohnella faecalis]|nr:anthranilate synthase component I family protein [Cohnella faecalis]
MITLEQWEQWIRDPEPFSLLPYVRRIEGAIPLFWDRFWEEASAYGCLFESGKGGRYTTAALRPVSVVHGKGRRAQSLERSAVQGVAERWDVVREWDAAPLEAVREWGREWRAPQLEERQKQELPDCLGGAFGFWSYDIVRSLERIPSTARDDLELPDYLFSRFEELWIADQATGFVYLSVHLHVNGASTLQRTSDLELAYREAARRAERMERQWRHWCDIGTDAEASSRHAEMRGLMEQDKLQIDVEAVPGLVTSMSKRAYEEAVRRIQHYIGQGDVFQVNLSLRQSCPSPTKPEQLYEWLRLVNPSPYMGMIRTPSFSLVSASPELLVKLEDGRLSTRPIAGTRRRGHTPEEDRAMELELLASEKERAEHVMLVDLERNDLGRVSAYGTVKVPELLTVERYSHVMHLVSQVEGRIAAGKDAFDVMAAVFPGGTITGAPKIRTMEIIEELEPLQRGAYTGSMGWIDYAGDMEFNIIIRTMVVKDGVCHIQAGAGIVIDSDPEREFHESLNKAKALWKAVQYGEKLPVCERKGEPT